MIFAQVAVRGGWHILSPSDNYVQLASTPGSYTNGIWQMVWIATGAKYGSINYGTLHPLSATDSSTAIGNFYISINLYTASVSSTMTATWARAREYPPSGVMPSASFGSVTNSASGTYTFSATAGSGGGVACSTGGSSIACTGSYAIGNVIIITATPNTNEGLSGWAGTSCSGASSSPCTLTMPAKPILKLQASAPAISSHLTMVQEALLRQLHRPTL